MNALELLYFVVERDWSYLPMLTTMNKATIFSEA